MSAHIIIAGSSLECTRCGVVEALQLPLAIVDFIGSIHAFEAVHDACPPIVPKPLNPGAGPSFTRSMLDTLGVPLYGCGACYDCLSKTDGPHNSLPLTSMVKVFCPTCGHGRCPHASDHNFVCENSNAPGQIGRKHQ